MTESNQKQTYCAAQFLGKSSKNEFGYLFKKQTLRYYSLVPPSRPQKTSILIIIH